MSRYLSPPQTTRPNLIRKVKKVTVTENVSEVDDIPKSSLKLIKRRMTNNSALTWHLYPKFKLTNLSLEESSMEYYISMSLYDIPVTPPSEPDSCDVRSLTPPPTTYHPTNITKTPANSVIPITNNTPKFNSSLGGKKYPMVTADKSEWEKLG